LFDHIIISNLKLFVKKSWSKSLFIGYSKSNKKDEKRMEFKCITFYVILVVLIDSKKSCV